MKEAGNVNEVHYVYKNRTETPLEAIERFRLEKGLAPEARLTYLGRLDPMAEGMLLVGEGMTEEGRKKYLGLDKVYRVTFMLGVQTDTDDVLGKIINEKDELVDVEDGEDLEAKIKKVVESFTDITEMPYHPFSSKPINGISLFDITKEHEKNNINFEGEIPTKKVSIKKAEIISFYKVHTQQIINEIIEDIKKVHGEFRQNEIIELWSKKQQLFEEKKIQELPMCEVEIACSSGTYMRNFAHIIGHEIGIPVLAYRIVRTYIG